MKVNNKCVLDDAMTGQGLEPCAPRWMSASHEQTRRVAPPPVQLGTGHDHIRAGQLVKHLSGLRFGTGDCPSASQRRIKLSRFVVTNLCQMTQVGKLCEEIQLMKHRLCLSLSCD